MISLSTFLANNINEQNGGCLLPTILKQQIVNGLNAYIKHLQTDNPKTIEWANIEKQLIIALEHMEAPDKIKNEKSPCNHKWVHRLDGYEEQCGPAICTLCGKYGCYCDAKYSSMTKLQKIEFHEKGVNGNNHELERKNNENAK